MTFSTPLCVQGCNSGGFNPELCSRHTQSPRPAGRAHPHPDCAMNLTLPNTGFRQRPLSNFSLKTESPLAACGAPLGSVPRQVLPRAGSGCGRVRTGLRRLRLPGRARGVTQERRESTGHRARRPAPARLRCRRSRPGPALPLGGDPGWSPRPLTA